MSINLASTQSALVTDSYGVSHIVWADSGYIWHAVYDNNSETWKNAEVVAFTGNEPVTSINLVANDKLISGSNPGLAVVWQQGNLNDSDFFYTAAQYDANADLQWLDTPQALTSDQVGDLEPTVTVNSSGEVIVIGSKVNFDNVANLSIKEDTDFYTQTFSVNSSQFSTSTNTFTPNAPYSPQLTNDGLVNMGVLTSNTQSTNQAVQSATESDGFGISSETEQPGQNPLGSWNAQLFFASSLLEDWELLHSVPKSGFLRSIITPFMKNWEIAGTLSGGQNFGWGDDEASLFLQTNAQLEWKSPLLHKVPFTATPTVDYTDSEMFGNLFADDQENVPIKYKESPIKFGFDLDSVYNFATNSPYDLISVDNVVSLSASVQFPIISAAETAGFLTVDATGSLGISFNFLGEAIEGQTYSPQTLLAAIKKLEIPIVGGGVADGAILLINLANTGTTEGSGAGIIAADIAFNVADTFVAFVNGTLEGLKPSGSISFPIFSLGVVGKAQIPHVPILSADINGGVRTAFNWGIGNTDNTISLTFPIGFEVKIGPLGFGVNFNPGWNWDILDGNKNEDEENSNVSSETDSSELSAQVSGSLITLNFASSLSAIPQPEDFTVSTTDINGNITNIPVFNVIRGNSDTSFILQLENSIPISENLDYTSSDNPQPTSNPVTLSFTNNDNITDSEGNPIANISSIAVSNTTPNSLAYQYNPTSGNSQKYINPTLLLAFSTSLDTSINPDLDRFSVTSGNTQLSVTNAQVTSNGVLLTFASSVTNQSLQNVSISYNDSSSLGDNPLKDSNGGSIESFTIQSGVSAQVSQTSLLISNNNSGLTLSATPSEYSVTVTNADGTTVSGTFTVQTATLNNGNVLLTLNQGVQPDQIVTIVYKNQNISNSLVTGITPPTVSTQSLMASIEADLGQDSAPFIVSGGSSPLLAWVADAPPLEVIAGFVNNKTITLNFIDELGNGTDVPKASQFTVTDSNNNSYTVGNVSVSGNSLNLTLNTAVTGDTQLNISYNLSTPTANNTNLFLNNSFTNTTLWINQFSDFALTNTTVNTNPPIILGAGAIVESNTSNQITLVFDQKLTNNSVTNSDFTVESNGQVYSIEANVTVNANTVILTVQPPEGGNLIGNGDIVTVSYTGNSLSSSNGNVANFNNQPVITSPSTPTTVIKYAFLNSAESNLVSSISSIPGTGGFNFNPVGAYDPVNNVTVLVWSNADSSGINTNLTPGEFYTDDEINFINESFNQSDVYYSVYNYSTKSWTIASPIAQQQGSEGKIVIGEWVNNQLMTAWINYNNGESNIYWSSLTYNNGVATWSNPEILYTDANPDPLTELSIVTINGKPTVLWTETQPVSYSQLTQQESPLLYYRLAETSGTTLVNEGIYGAGGNGTYSGSVTFGEGGALENATTNEGDANPAVLFNSGNSAISSTIPLSGTSFSVEFWFKVPSLPSNTLDLVSASGLMNVTLNNSGLSLNINGSALNSDGFTPSANEWYYVVATYNGETNTANLYVNGDNVGSLDNVDLTIPSNTSLTLAGSSNDSVYLDEVAFYRQALTYNDTPNISDFGNLTPSQISQLFFNTSQIGNKYNSQYITPLPPGPNTNYVTYNGNSWSVPSVINPTYKPIATQLSDANKALWDVTSFTTANSSGYVNPNGNPDIFLSLNLLGNQVTGNKISSIVVTATNSNNQTITWSVGNTNGNQLAVVQGDKLLNPINPDGSFNYTILSPSVDLDLFLDAGSNTFPSSTNFNVTINYNTGSSTTQTLQARDVTSEPTTINSNQVLGIATVTEANDSSLTLIDSGFIINTNNPSIGYSIVSGDFNNDKKSDVAVGNRGYTDTSGNVLGQGTIQILFGGGAVLSNNESNPLTTTDLSGNPNGVLITGLSDTGQANGDYPFSMATGDVNGDGYEDLVIGDPNANQVYVIYGSNNLSGKTINVTNLGSQGYIINAPNPNIGFGYSVAVGNFNSNAQSNGTYATGTKFDIAIGAPGANNGNGAVYVAFDGASNNLTTVYNSANKGELAGYSLAVSSRTAKAKTFTGNTTSDDLIIGAIGYEATVTNQWTGLSGLPNNTNQNNSYPSTSDVQLGAVYVYQSNGTTTLTEYVSYTGPNFPTSNGTGTNTNAGSALNSSDLDGDGINDLAISVPGASNNNGVVYVLKGGVSKNNNPQNLGNVANLGIVGGLPSSQTGAIITSPGDVNNDGNEDFLITAPQGANGTGQGYVLFGPLNLSDIGTIFNLNVTANDSKTTFLLNGSQPYQLVGAGASGIGDVNSDGVNDLMISAPNAGQLYTIFGHPWLADDGSIKLANISGDNGFIIDGDLYSIEGYTLGLSNSSTNSTYNINIPVGVLFLLNPQGKVIWQSPNTTPAVQALMQTDGNFVLYSQAQPVNEPGAAQFAVWASNTWGNSGAYLSLAQDGGLYIVSNSGSILKTLNRGSASATTNNTTLQEANQITSNSNTFISNPAELGLIGNGNNVVMLGDVNGDGFADVLSGGSEKGGILIFGNSTTNLVDAATGTNNIVITVSNGTIKKFVALGDINGDGLQDLGVIDNNNNFYVQLGSRSLPALGSTISLSTVDKTSIINALGVGDYNGDGYDDLLLSSSNGVQSFYKGNPSGTLNSSETFNGGSNNIFNSIGDVNGDGFDDIGGGAPNSNQVSPFSSIANGGGTVYLGNSAVNSNHGNTLSPPTAGVSAPLQTDSWFISNFNPPQSTKFNGAPSLAVYNDYLYMGYTGVNNSSNNGSPFVQRSADGFNWEDLTNFQQEIGQASTGFTLAVFNDTLYAAYLNTKAELIITYATPSSNALGLEFSSSQNYSTGTYPSYVSPALAVYQGKLYVFYATGDEYNSSFGYYYSSDGKTWTQVASITLPDGKTTIPNGFLPLGASFAVTTDENNLYLSYATGTGSSTSNSLTFATFSVTDKGSSWTYSSIDQTPLLRGSGLLSVGDTLYNFYLPSSGNMNVTTFPDQSGKNWSASSLVQGVSNQYWLTYPNPVYFQENIYLGYGSQNGNVQVAYAISDPIYQSNQTQQFGQQLENIGDFNGDGIDDFAVLAPGFFSNVSIWNWNNKLLENNKGAVLIYYGSTSGFDETSNPDLVLGTPKPTTSTNVANNQALLLTQFAPAGDMNGDGYDDLIIASPNTALNSNNTTDGVAFVVFGGKNWGNTYSATNPFDLNSLSNNQANSTTNNSNENGFLITGLPSSQAGISLSGGGDVNGDGFTDFIIGAPGDNDNLTYVIFGSDFTNKITQTGTIGDDVMIGTPTGESFIGGEGNDQIFTNGGIDVVYAGPGDDFVTVNDTYFRRLDGGAGTDVLRFEGYNGQDWNLTTLSPGSRLRNFEILVTEGYGANTLTLNSLTVTQLSPNNTVTVVMDVKDTLNLSSDFIVNGTVYQYNQKFDQYTSNTSGATVLLNRITGDEVTETSQLVLTEEGSLVLQSSSGEQLWTAENNGVQVKGAVQALMQTDGNFVLYSQVQPTNQPGSAQYSLWASNTRGNGGAYLQLGADGGLYIKSSGGNILSTLNSGNPNNPNITNPSRLNEQQELLSNDSLTATLTQIPNLINVTQNAPLTNTPTSNSTAEVASVSAETMTSYNVDESGNNTAQSFASSFFSATASDSNAPTSLSVSNPTANEADGEVEFTIQRTGDLDKYVQVHYITQDGRAKAGSHYNPVLGRAVFKPGETTKTVSVPLILDDIYTGTRDLGLLVTLEKESDTILNDEFHLNVDPSNGQIRNWNHIIGEKPNSVMGGELEFRVTATDGKSQVKVYFEGSKDFNNYYIFNNETQRYEAFKGAQLFDEDGDGKYEGAILNLQDGSEHDIDNSENGIIFKRGFFADGESPDVLLDTAMYRFRNVQMGGTYLYVGAEERASVLANYSSIFVEEGLAFYVSDTAEDGLIAFNRFQNANLPGTYLYAEESESQSIRESYPNFVEEGIAFYAYPQGSQMADSITRFQNSVLPGTYLYTGQPETDNVISNYPNFNLEGIAFEALLG